MAAQKGSPAVKTGAQIIQRSIGFGDSWIPVSAEMTA
jgi:hypothetical protein